MFDIYNEARRLNEILAEHAFGPRWTNDAYLFGIWCHSEKKGATAAIKLADEYASKSTNYNKFSKEDYAKLCTTVRNGIKDAKKGYTLKAVDSIKIDLGYIEYLKTLPRNIRNVLFTFLVWEKVKESIGQNNMVIYYSVEKSKAMKQAAITKAKDAEILKYFVEIPAIKYSKKNPAGVKGYRPTWYDNVTLNNEYLTISGNSELGYAYGDYLDDDLHNPGRILDGICSGTGKCEICGKIVPRVKGNFNDGKLYCPQHLAEEKTKERIKAFDEALNSERQEIITVCRKCGKKLTIQSKNKMYEKALQGNFVCSDCRSIERRSFVCVTCGETFVLDKRGGSAEQILNGTAPCECAGCAKKRRRRESYAKKKQNKLK